MNTDATDEIQLEGDEAQESPDLSTPSEEREILTKAGDPEKVENWGRV